MAIENTLESIGNSLDRIAVALQTMAKNQNPVAYQAKPATAIPAPTAAVQPAQPVEGKRRPGRPSFAEKAAEAAKVQPAPVVDNDNFLDDPPSTESPEDFLGEDTPAAEVTAKVYTRDEVRAELIKYGKRLNNSEAARKLLKDVGGVDIFQSLPESKFNAVVAACGK